MTTSSDLRRFTGKVAIVTGGAGGIGLAVSRRLAREGAHVVIAGRDGESARAAASKVSEQSGTEALGLSCDVGEEPQVEACVARTLKRFSRLDVIINNAGLMTFKTLSEWSAEDWMQVLRVDLVGAALFTREAFRHMGEAGGAIVNIASVHADRTTANVAPYAAAKAAMLSLTRSTAIEGRDARIRANAVLPGAIDTPMLWDNPNIKAGIETIEKADLGRPDDIAAAVAFLASEEARFITGASLSVDGGRLAKL